MKAAALDYAAGGPAPLEVSLKSYIDAFGVEAVTGRRMLYAGEMQRMIVAENIVKAYLSRDAYRDQSGNANWAEWAKHNPTLNRILIDATKAAYDGE